MRIVERIGLSVVVVAAMLVVAPPATANAGVIGAVYTATNDAAGCRPVLPLELQEEHRRDPRRLFRHVSWRWKKCARSSRGFSGAWPIRG